jgi:hypothetical protein
MTDMSTTKELSGDIFPPSSQHTEVPIGTFTDTKTSSINNNL